MRSFLMVLPRAAYEQIMAKEVKELVEGEEEQEPTPKFKKFFID